MAEDRAREIIEGLVWQFGDRFSKRGVPYLGSGFLSAMEDAFDFLGWPDPKPCPEGACQVPGCGEWATCGTPTRDGGYIRCCGEHFREPDRG